MDFRFIENDTIYHLLREELERLEVQEHDFELELRRLKKKYEKAMEAFEKADTDKNRKRLENIDHQIFVAEQAYKDISVTHYDIYQAYKHYKTSSYKKKEG